MKAVLYHRYGPPEVLQLQEVEPPTPDDTQVLVRVRAASLNPADWRVRKGQLVARVSNGWLRPRNPMMGADFSGRVEAVGKNVTQFQPGDEVFGRRSSNGLAEYVCVSEKPIVVKPASITFEQAAALPVAGLTALQSVRDAGAVQPGQTMLVNGASGGVGTFTVQIAKSFGAHVTGVCSTKHLDLVRSIGADEVIDYTREDFTQKGQRYDVIIDNAGNRSVLELRRVLKPHGICVLIGAKAISLLFLNMGLGRVISATSGQKIGFMLSKIRKEDLTRLASLVESGKMMPVLDRCYPLQEVVAASRYVEQGHPSGKVVITFGEQLDAMPSR